MHVETSNLSSIILIWKRILEEVSVQSLKYVHIANK